MCLLCSAYQSSSNIIIYMYVYVCTLVVCLFVVWVNLIWCVSGLCPMTIESLNTQLLPATIFGSHNREHVKGQDFVYM